MLVSVKINRRVSNVILVYIYGEDEDMQFVLGVDSGGVGSFDADVAGLGGMAWEVEGERRGGASETGFTNAAIFMLAV